MHSSKKRNKAKQNTTASKQNTTNKSKQIRKLVETINVIRTRKVRQIQRLNKEISEVNKAMLEFDEASGVRARDVDNEAVKQLNTKVNAIQTKLRKLHVQLLNLGNKISKKELYQILIDLKKSFKWSTVNYNYLISRLETHRDYPEPKNPSQFHKCGLRRLDYLRYFNKKWISDRAFKKMFPEFD